MNNLSITKNNLRDAAHSVVETVKSVSITSSLYAAMGVVKAAQGTEHLSQKIQTRALQAGDRAAQWLQAQAR